MFRRFAFLFLAALLVLRGLLGDAMAMGTQAPASAPHAVAIAHAHQGARAGGEDHAHAAQHCQDRSGAPGCSQGRDGSVQACSACGLCHLAPLVASVAPAGAPPLDAAAPAARSARFASAPIARAIRPPIA